MPTYNWLDEMAKDLSNNLDKLAVDVIEEITEQYVLDSFQSKFVPVMDEDLSLSIYDFSTPSKGEVIWQTPYAEIVYESNVTGVEEWDVKIWDKYVNDYESIARDVIDDELL